MTRTVQPEIVESLRALTGNVDLPTHVRKSAESLLARLTQPVRVTVLGKRGSGKSSIANLLLGRSILPLQGDLPTLLISGAKQEEVRCTLADGSVRKLARFDPDAVAALAPIYVEIDMDLPALGRISLLEVVAPTVRDLERAVRWADSRTDIAIWCSQFFDEEERTIWQATSDRLKDHSILAVTRADELIASGRLEATLADLNERAIDHFNHILPISTPDALAARRPDGSIDRDRLTRSGGRALVATVLREIELGLQIAIDRAELLVAKHAHPDQSAQAAAGDANEEASIVPAPEHGTTQEIAAEADAGDAPLVLTERAEPSSPPAEGSRPVPSPVPEAGTAARSVHRLRPVVAHRADADGSVVEEKSRGMSEAARAALELAINRLARHGRVAQSGPGRAPIEPKKLLAEVIESVEWLAEYLAERANGDPALARIRDAAFDASDLLQLMQMEDDAESLRESLAVVIQLKREMEANLAA